MVNVQKTVNIVRNLLEEKPCTIITTLESGMEHLIPLSHYKAHTLEFKKDEDIERFSSTRKRKNSM